MAEDVKQEMNTTPGCIPSKWTRNTVADGDWLQKYTIGPLSSRDNFLADKISGAELNIDEEIEARKAGDAYLSANLIGFSAEYFEFKDNVETSAENLSATLQEEIDRAKNAETNLDSRLNTERTDRINEDAKLQRQLDTLKAATDVIAVFGTYEEFTAASAGSWQQTVTDNDFIKVIRDDHYQPNQNDPDYNTTDDDVYQVYYEYHETNHDGWSGWSAIGSLDPYYSVSEIDVKEEQLSATIANTYLSAKGAVLTGKNIVITEDSNNPKITIATKDNVTFDGVSSTTLSATTAYGSSAKFDNISATTVTALTATGNSAKFTNISANKISADLFKSDLGTVDTFNLKFTSAGGDKLTVNESKAIQLTAGTLYGQSYNSNVDSLIGSAEDGQFAYNVINSAKFSAVGTTTSTAYISGGIGIEAGNGVGVSLNGKNVVITAEGTTYNAGDYISTADKTISVTGNLVGSAESGQSAYNWITGQSATLQAGQGIGFYSAGPNILGISADAQSPEPGRCIEIGADNSINLSSRISANEGVLVSGYSTHPQYVDITPEQILIYDYGFPSTQALFQASYLSASAPDGGHLTSVTASATWYDIAMADKKFVKVNSAASGSNLSANVPVSFVVTATIPNSLNANTYYII